MDKVVVGNVISIEGTNVIVIMHDNTNVLNYYYNGVYYSGITVGAYVGILRGPYKIIGKVEKEYLTDIGKDVEKQSYELERYERKIQLKIVGTIFKNEFELGIKSYPMVYNEVVLLNSNELLQLILPNKSANNIKIGTTFDGVDAMLDFTNLFNTHIGVFGNTGSGKSNTLAKLYASLFELNDGKKIELDEKSEFVFIDFNGEYIGNKILTGKKKVLNLSTRRPSKEGEHNSSKDGKIQLTAEEFWDVETLSILFSATEKTQQPFLNASINYYKKNDRINLTSDKIIEAIGWGFYNTFKFNNHKESLNLLRKVFDVIFKIKKYEFAWNKALWNANTSTYYIGEIDGNAKIFFNSLPEHDITEKMGELKDDLRGKKNEFESLKHTEKLIVIVYLRLIYGLSYGHVQFEHVNPLIQRIESRSIIINKLIEISEDNNRETVEVVSLKKCNMEAKKLIPLLLAKQYYHKHKEKNDNDQQIEHTFHLIIDEAHNILSSDSNREEATWKDYRLEVFEEIIKEGRKFGFFLTISSQRPSDISPTIISQLHNYFLHRLVNENDIKMISNTINSLDTVSKESIPNLAAGQCIATGTSFDLPILIQVEQLNKELRPNSDNVNLEDLWRMKETYF